jgi:phytol kinase
MEGEQEKIMNDMNYVQEIEVSLLVCVLYTALFAGVEWWSRGRVIDVELTRKVVHFGAGMIALPFPWIFQSHWTVLILALPFVSLLVYAKRTKLLPSVQGVERITVGEIIYPIAICSTLLLSSLAGSRWLYVAALLTLALADALAGIIGKRYGRRIFHVNGGKKSLEGSYAFLVTAFVVVALSLLLSGKWSIEQVVLGSLLASLLATALEAVTPNGFDNLVVPLGTWTLLAMVTGESWQHLLTDIAVLLLAAGICFGVLVRAKVVNVTGAIVTTLMMFGTSMLAIYA